MPKRLPDPTRSTERMVHTHSTSTMAARNVDTPENSYSNTKGSHSSRNQYSKPTRPQHLQTARLSDCSTATLEVMSQIATNHQSTDEGLSPDRGGSMFELFRTFDGEEYTVYVREDGKRFYVDWEEQVGTL